MFGVLLLGVGCGVSVRDLPTQQECMGGGGRDRCNEPACWYYAACRKQATTAASGASDAGTNAKHLDASSQPLRDAGGTGPTVVPVDDGGTLKSDSGQVAPPASCGNPPVKCSASEVCANGTCMPVSGLPGDFMIEITSAYVPIQYQTTICFDAACAVPVPAVICPCKPDPFVRVLVDGAKQSPDTTAKKDTLDPAWTTDLPRRVHLDSSSVIVFEAWDDDSDEFLMPQPQFMFRCSPSLGDLSIGVLKCSPNHATVVALLSSDPFPYHITANITQAPPLQ